MIQIAIRSGIAICDFERISIGELLDIIEYQYDDTARANGIEVVDYDEQYNRLQGLKPQIEAGYAEGTISKERYDEFMNRIRDLR